MSLRRRQAGRGVLDMRTGRATLPMVISSPLTATEYLVCEENAGDEKFKVAWEEKFFATQAYGPVNNSASMLPASKWP